MAVIERCSEKDSVWKSATQTHRAVWLYVHDVFSVLHCIVFRGLRSQPVSLGKDSSLEPITGILPAEILERPGTHRSKDAGEHRCAERNEPGPCGQAKRCTSGRRRDSNARRCTGNGIRLLPILHS